MINEHEVSQSMLIIQQKNVTRKMCENISDSKLLNEAVYQICQAISEGYELCNLGMLHQYLLGRKMNTKDEHDQEIIEDCREMVRRTQIGGLITPYRRKN